MSYLSSGQQFTLLTYNLNARPIRLQNALIILVLPSIFAL